MANIISRIEALEAIAAEHEEDVVSLQADLDDAYNEISTLAHVAYLLEERVKELEDIQSWMVSDIEYLYGNEYVE